MTGLRLWKPIAVVAALVCAFVPVSPDVVERVYSTRAYPAIQHLVTPLSNALPIAVLDLLILAAVAAVVTGTARSVRNAWRGRTLRPIGALVGNLVSTAAVAYLVFVCVWGFNYRRVRMYDRLVMQPAAPSRGSVVALGFESVRRLNSLYAKAHASGWSTPEWRNEPLRAAFRAVQTRLSDASPAEPGRLKRTLLGPYFRWSSVDGMVDPFALEVLANPDLLPWERPFVAAHEWSHLAGYANESEANFVGWLTCLEADAPAQYSGWLFVYWQVRGEVGADDRAKLAAALADGPRHDVDAIVDRLRRGQLPMLRNASWAVYDEYLRANRVENGIRSYDEALTLILRARFEDGWVPVRRTDRASSR